jgi:hypothetical protein
VATWLDLAQRLEETVYTDERLHCEAAYRGEDLPQWLSSPLATATKNADTRLPLVVLNVKGRSVGDSLCLLRLRDLEALLGVAGAATQPVIQAETGQRSMKFING